MFSKWVVIVILFTFAENSLDATSRELAITDLLNQLLFNLMEPFGRNSLCNEADTYSYEVAFRVINKKTNDASQNAINFHTMKLKFHISQFSKIRFFSSETNFITIAFEMVSMSLKGYLENTHHYIATELIPMNFSFTFHVPTDIETPISVNYHDFNEYDIQLLTDGYQYKPNEEDEIKRKLKSHLESVMFKTAIQEYTSGFHIIPRFTSLIEFKLLPPEIEQMNPYYFIDTIPSADYTLSNIKIRGLSNLKSTLLRVSKFPMYPERELGDVTGTMMQNFPSQAKQSLELSFTVDSIYIWYNVEGNLYIKAEGYLVKNTKTGKMLSNGQSKLIIVSIVSAIAAQIKAAEEGPKY